jgi:hypothetical protein
MRSHPDEGFTRLALRLHMAWACAGLSGVQRAVLDVLAIECWSFGRKGYVASLGSQRIAELTGASQRQVNDALRVLSDQGFVRRLGRGSFELIPEVPPTLARQVSRWYERVSGGNPPETGGNPPERSGRPPRTGGFPPETGGKPPERHKGTRAREDQINCLTSSSSVPQTSRASARSRARTDDDDTIQKQAIEHLTVLLPWLAELMAGQLDRRKVTVLEELKQARARPSELAKACAGLLVAMRNENFKVRDNPVGLLKHALRDPERYPDVEPAELIQALHREQRLAEERKRLAQEQYEASRREYARVREEQTRQAAEIRARRQAAKEAGERA